MKSARTRYDTDGFAIFKCFYGTSKMNKQELSEVINIVVSWAIELGIPTQEELYM